MSTVANYHYQIRHMLVTIWVLMTEFQHLI